MSEPEQRPPGVRDFTLHPAYDHDSHLCTVDVVQWPQCFVGAETVRHPPLFSPSLTGTLTEMTLTPHPHPFYWPSQGIGNRVVKRLDGLTPPMSDYDR